MKNQKCTTPNAMVGKIGYRWTIMVNSGIAADKTYLFVMNLISYKYAVI
jgi:hypothetical protein